MTLKIDTHEDENRQLNVTIEVADARVQKQMKKTARKLARELRVPGFRPGKAPFSIIRGYVGEESLRAETLQALLPQVYDEALKEIDVQPYVQPTLDDVQHEPMVLKMTIPLEPAVDLGDYRAMRKEIAPVTVSDEAIEEAMQATLDRAATTEVVERAAAMGDTVTLAGQGHLGDDESDIIFKDEGFETRLEEDGIFPGTPFVENIVGMSADDEKSFSFTFADDDEDAQVAGKEAHFTIKLVSVQERTVPEMTDEFVAEQGGDADTVEALRAETADNLQKQAESQFKNDLLEESITEIIENVEELSYSPAVVEAEITEMVNSMKQRVEQAGMQWDQYIASSDMSEAEMREDYEESAVERVERRLVFQQFVENEKIELTDEEVDAKMEEQLATYDESFREIMRNFMEQQGTMMIRQELLMDKVHERLLAVYAGEAPDLDAEPDADGGDSDEGESEDSAETTAETQPEPVAEAASEDTNSETEES